MTASTRRRNWRYWLRLLIFGAVAGLLMFELGVNLVWVESVVQPAHRPICCQTPADVGYTYEDVTFTGGDDLTLSGWYLPSENGAAVILLHGSGADRREMFSRAQTLADAGYGVLLYDRRGHGESGGDQRCLGWDDIPDVAAALAFLQARPEVDADRVGIVGFSVGGQVAIRAAAQLDGLRAVVADGTSLTSTADAPPTASLIDGLRWVENRLGFLLLELRLGRSTPTGVVDSIGAIAPRPLLLIATGPPDGFEQWIARHYLAQAAEPVELWTIPETGHGGGPSARPDEYAERLAAFFDAALAP